MLRRFLMAWFALHFLLSVGAFTLQMQPVQASAPAEQAWQTDGDGPVLGAAHGLTDAAPDMPDGPAFFLHAVQFHTLARHALWGLFHGQDDPAPWGRDRPPRSAQYG